MLSTFLQWRRKKKRLVWIFDFLMFLFVLPETNGYNLRDISTRFSSATMITNIINSRGRPYQRRKKTRKLRCSLKKKKKKTWTSCKKDGIPVKHRWGVVHANIHSLVIWILDVGCYVQRMACLIHKSWIKMEFLGVILRQQIQRPILWTD